MKVVTTGELVELLTKFSPSTPIAGQVIEANGQIYINSLQVIEAEEHVLLVVPVPNKKNALVILNQDS